MKKTVNVICVFLIALALITGYYTVTNSKNSTPNFNPNNMEKPPEKPDDNQNNMNDSTKDENTNSSVNDSTKKDMNANDNSNFNPNNMEKPPTSNGLSTNNLIILGICTFVLITSLSIIVINLRNKKLNKEELQKELNLPIDKEIPMIGLVSRLTHQKGCDLIVRILGELLKEDIQVVIVGTGDYIYEESFKSFNLRYPEKISTNIRFSNELAHKVYAASDMFLMPSLFEPCGLGQLIALRYGSIPIVRETGGLKDTVIPYNEYTEEGNGFGFRNYSQDELLNTIRYSLNIFKDKNRWNKIIENSMKTDNSWEKSAKEYLRIYEELLRDKVQI